MKTTKNGITYHLTQDNVCFDVDVDESVTNFVFLAAVKYRLDVFKSFPNITEITIEEFVTDIKISNFMFPNVRHVTSYSLLFKTGSMLVGHDGVLYNSFCLNKDEVIDISGITDINEYALEGCRSIQCTDDDVSLLCSKDSFKGSMIELQPVEDNYMRFFGGIAVNANPKSDVVIIPDDTERVVRIDAGLNSFKDKTVVVHKWETLHWLNYQMPIKKLVVKADISHDNLYLIQNLKITEGVEFDEHNPYCKIKDNVIYSKNGKALYAALACAKGDIVIPDGVQTIYSNAFLGSKGISSITMPDSVKVIGDDAFSHCVNLKYVKLSSSVTEIPRRCFHRCLKLERIDFNGSISKIGMCAFNNCKSLKSLFSPERCQQGKALKNCKSIELRAFEGCAVETFQLSSNTFCEDESLIDAQNVYIDTSGDTKRIEEALKYVLRAVLFREEEIAQTRWYEQRKKGMGVVNIFIDEQQVCVPRCMRPCDKINLTNFLTHPCYETNLMGFLTGENFYTVFKNIPDVKLRQDCILYAYKRVKAKALESYMKKQAKTMALRYVEEKNEQSLQDLVSLDLMSGKTLHEVLNAISDSEANELNVVKAYVLDKLGGSDKSNFRL